MSMYSELSKYAKKVSDRGRASANFWKIPTGESQFRILPAAKGEDPGHFFLPTGCHYDVGSAKMVFCPASTGFDPIDPCPVCEMQRSMAASDDKNTQREAASMRVRERYAFNILVRNPSGADEVMVLLAPPSILQAIGMVVDREDRYGSVIDLKAGRDFIISRTGAGMTTRYAVSPDGITSKLTETKAEAMKIIGELRPMSAQLTCMSYEKIKGLLMGEELPAAAAAKTAPTSLGSAEDEMWEEESTEEAVAEDDSWEEGTADAVKDDAPYGDAPPKAVVEEEESDDEDWIDPDIPAPVEAPPDKEDPDAELRTKLHRRVHAASKGKGKKK